MSCRPFFFNNFRQTTYGRFPILWPQDDYSPRDQSATTEEVIQSVVDYYYQTLMLATKEDLLKVEPVLKLELMEVLSYLSYIIDKANKERQERQKTIS